MRNTVLFILFTFCLGTSVYSQNSGRIIGRVIDQKTKQPLPGANVQLVGLNHGAATGNDGSFEVENVPENIYKLNITYIGYQTHLETDVRVIRNKATFLQEIELYGSTLESDVIVVTSKTVNDDEEAPVSSYISSREQILRAPGAAGDIFRAIEAMPGVSTSGGEFSAFSVRGGSPRENIILVDNIPFGKLTHFDGGNEEEEAQGGRFSVFAPGVVEQAQFQAGGFSVEHGGKHSSILKLDIREGNRENFTIDARYDILGWETNYSGPSYLFNNTSLFLSARHQDFNQILKLTGQEGTGSPRFTDVIAKLTSNLNSKHKLSLLAIYSPEKFNRDRKHVLATDEYLDVTVGSVDEKKVMLGVNWRFLTSKSSFWRNTFYYSRVNSDVQFGSASPVSYTPGEKISENQLFERRHLNEASKDKEIGWRSSFNLFPGKNTSLILGLDFTLKDRDFLRFSDGPDTLYTFDANDTQQSPEQKFVVRAPEQLYAAFQAGKLFLASYGQYSFKPRHNLTINIGLRHEFNQFNKDHNYSPRGSLSYHLDDVTRLSFASGLYYQEPRLRNFTTAKENENLKNEQAFHVIVGLNRYIGAGLKFTGEIYYKGFDDLIVQNDRANNFLTNNGDGYAYGADLSLVKRFVDKFYGQINYSHSISKRNDRNGEGDYDSNFNQPQIFAILGGYEFNKEWTFSAKWRFATGRPQDTFIVHSDIFNNPAYLRYSKEITGNNAARLDNFHTLNIRIDYRKQLGRVALVSFLDVVNLYNHINASENRFIHLTGESQEIGFEILPTFGLKLEI